MKQFVVFEQLVGFKKINRNVTFCWKLIGTVKERQETIYTQKTMS